MGEFSISHLVIIAVILLVFFGPSRLPGLGASLGKAIRGFKEGINDIKGDDTAQNQSTPPPARRSEQISQNGAAGENITTTRDVNHVDDPTKRS